ncbi:short-chain dehydrogenase [Polyplosphaeria fusca]|uniref:Short-chain dehydrogenase n=1 Tax=Polyplosphaeria fusca TaxID=682080 RepID=A0A9P4RAD9_9PLEO|nr:short-chain dehydrogenase [Polyplosphaeria fusca]
MTNHFEMARKERWDLSILPPLTGKTALVTGANSSNGIGWHIAHQLAVKGAKVYLGARSLEKAQQAIADMIKTSPALSTEQLKPFIADLGDFKQVRTAAQDFLAKEARLDILVNNAGLLARPLDFDHHGISVSVATNHLGPFLLTTALLPLLKKTASLNSDVRVVNVASTTHYDVPSTAKFASLADLNASFGDQESPESQYTRYGFSKLMNVLFAAELQHRFDAEGVPIIAMSLNPGGVATDGAIKYIGGDAEVMKSIEGVFSPFEGAITPLFAAAHPEVKEQEKYKGAFLLPWGGVKLSSELARDERAAKDLWETSEKIVRDVLMGDLKKGD